MDLDAFKGKGFYQGLKLGIDKKELRARVLQDEANLLRVQACIYGNLHAAMNNGYFARKYKGTTLKKTRRC
jgi:hypothetical protein